MKKNSAIKAPKRAIRGTIGPLCIAASAAKNPNSCFKPKFGLFLLTALWQGVKLPGQKSGNGGRGISRQTSPVANTLTMAGAYFAWYPQSSANSKNLKSNAPRHTAWLPMADLEFFGEGVLEKTDEYRRKKNKNSTYCVVI